MPQIADFKLKRFFNQPLAASAKANLSSSLAEVLSLEELLSFEPGAEQAYTKLGLGYTQLNGGEELRTLIAAQYRHVTADDVIVTSGSDDAFVVLFSALLEAGNHTVVQAPAYQPLMSLAEWRGSAVSAWRCREENAWQPSVDGLSSLLARETRLVVVNTPHNPTGYSFHAEELATICKLAESRSAIVIADEVYRELPLTGSPGAPAAADLSLTALSIGSLTKAYGLPGLRVGWIASRNRAVMEQVRRLRMHFNTLVPAPSEFLASLAMRNAARILERNRGIARANFEELKRFLARHADQFTCRLPTAGVIAYPRWTGLVTTQTLSDELLRAKQLLLAPAECFDAGDRHVRFGFGTSGFRRALHVLGGYLEERF